MLYRLAFAALLAGTAHRATVAVDFATAPSGNPVFVEPGESLFVLFSAYNQSTNPVFLWQSGLSVACLCPPCTAPAPVFNSLLSSELGPGLSPGLQPGEIFTGVLYTLVFPSSDSPDNAFLVQPRVNFTGYSAQGDIYGPATTVVVVPEPVLGNAVSNRVADLRRVRRTPGANLGFLMVLRRAGR